MPDLCVVSRERSKTSRPVECWCDVIRLNGEEIMKITILKICSHFSSFCLDLIWCSCLNLNHVLF